MICQKCGNNAKCIDSRERPEGRRRRYACECNARFTTIEVHVDLEPGRPGMPRNASTAAHVLREQITQEVKNNFRALLEQL